MHIRNVRLEKGFGDHGGSVKVACGVCKVKRRKAGRFYVRWVLDSGNQAVGTVCMTCLAKEAETKLDTYFPVKGVRKAKDGVCTYCMLDAKGGVKFLVEHSAWEKAERHMCMQCVEKMTGVRR